ncbi:6-chlorohydroxyquinol-1,2-dioxygenase [Subtercola boreus]|uniref:6-chlorohydroxyquinol-1,2-dioxygenase n=1 Tax=Subtercola boreus TaxID=120213 RepID=A0A3E0VBW3_9MICO|nr:dioxygenase [Subtercola boreus]RFA06998.1 6-chlorohydroxyquinol-1,2-dioxygenase [Subtercola boreus]
MDVTSEEATDVVVEAFSKTPDPRLREVLVSATRHLHAFVQEVDPTMAEWEVAIDFLTRTGHKSDDVRQEFMLLSDVFGVTMLVETLESLRHSNATTAATVLGPFHMTVSPRRELGESIDEIGSAVPCIVEGTVTSVTGEPIPHATVDVWQADSEGFYDVQTEAGLPEGNGRGFFTADENGAFWFRTVVPAFYPIPTDGPVGELLRASARHPYRPAHIHFIADAPGFLPITTHCFVADSPYIDEDAVFAVKSSLITPFERNDDLVAASRFGLDQPFDHARFDIVLAPAEGA